MTKSGFDEPLDAGFLYRPHYWPHSKPWTPKPGQCRADVDTRGLRCSSHQCSKKAKVTRSVMYRGQITEIEYCGLHDPVAVKAKREARTAKWRAEWAEQDAAAAEKERQAAVRDAALAAIKQIASGHNDPRALALEVLAKHGEAS